MRHTLVQCACIALMALSCAPPPADDTEEIAGPWPTLQLVPSGVIDDVKLDASVVQLIAVSMSGDVAVYDKAVRLQVFRGPDWVGTQVGRRGEGPGEYRGIVQMAWMHDTLVTVDRRLSRLSFYGGPQFDVLSTKLVQFNNAFRPLAWVANGRTVHGFHQNSRTIPAEVASVSPQNLPEMLGYRVIPTGFSEQLPGMVDTVEVPPGLDCEDRRGGNIQIFDWFFPSRGSRRAVSRTGLLVSAHPAQFSFTVRGAPGTAERRLTFHSFPAVPVTDRIWDSVAKDYLAGEALAPGGFRACTAPVQRPATVPAIRAMVMDEQDRVWVETIESDGEAIRIFTLDGKAVGRVALPPRDVSVPWVVANDRLYLVTADADGLQSVRIYEVKP